MPSFVLLFHQCSPESARASHWDFMLESVGVLRTWALSEDPTTGNLKEAEIAAEKLPDHRLAYLDYEGPLSAGRGNVERVEAGQFEILSETECELVLELASDLLAGKWILRSISTDENQWLLRRI